MNYGIPAKIKTDNRTVFAYKRKNLPSDEDDVLTQYVTSMESKIVQ